MNNFSRRITTFILAILMLISVPVQAFAQVTYNYENLKSNKANIVNNEKLPVEVAKTNGKAAEEIIKNPDMPKLYTMRADYKLPRNDEEVIGYQPYIATVGDEKVLTDEEKLKINKTIDLPDIDGYTSPTKSFTVNYDYIKKNDGEGYWDGNEYKREHPYLYKAKQGTIKIKHTFQKLENRDEYGHRDGDTNFIYTSQTGVTGTSVTIKALDGEKIKGYEPEVNVLTTQVPQNSADFEIEMRYNRAIYDVNFDSAGGTELPGMTLIYGQTIPKLNFDIKKLGATLQGWKVNKDINYVDADGNKKTLSTDDLITKADFEVGGKFQDGIKNAMSAESLTFTAQWTENDKADYVIQFWTEKPDYNDQDDTLPLRDRYDFIGARRIDNADTGSTPELTDLDIHGITFPDLNDGRLEKAQEDKEEFERYYFLNEKLTKEQNASKEDPNVQKEVLATGETVYNVYYDRRVYTLYFTAPNEEGWDPSSSYWPTITRNGKVIGTKGSPYKVEARFNQSLDKIWPRDEELSGLPPASSSPDGDMGPIGWTINVNEPGELIFRDTPPYRLSAEDFIDSDDVKDYGFGHGDQIPIGENETKARDKYEISLGSTSWVESVVHHIDIIKDDFDGNEQIDYDLSYWKSDTNANYAFILPNLQGFTLKEETREAEWIFVNPKGRFDKSFDELNAERNEKTPFRSETDKIEYIDKFPWGTKSFEGRNAYNFANYSRNKYKLKLNNDPKTVKNDNEYGEGNILDVPYEFPLKDLELDTKYVPTRPAWVPDDWSFLGWALDPAGENLVKDGKETKLHYDQVLYAKWGEPETIWKVKFDPNGGNLRNLSPENISDESKKLEIDGEVHTYPEKVAGEPNTFNFVHKMILKEPEDGIKNTIEPTRPGYNFAGWEFVRYTKDENGNDTEIEDTSYKDLYKVPEMYHFGNKVVGNVYLRAIWNKQDLITVKAIHHFLYAGYKETSKELQNLYNRRVGSYTTGLGGRQGDKYLLVPQAEWDALYNANTDYQTYKDETGRENSYNQILRVEPEKVHDPDTGGLVDNPKAKNNRFEFFYKPFKERVYDVNYLDERGKTEVEAFMEKAKAAYKAIKDNTQMSSEEKSAAYKELLAKNKEEFANIKKEYAIVPNETVVNGKRHYDARNYREIPGWVLNDKPQQQLFFDIYEDTDTFAGINESGLDEINFFYKDVRVIEVKEPDDPVPDGYKRVTFIADDGGNFTDDNDNPVKELYYDVIVGLKSDNLPVPEKLEEGQTKEEGKYYITPDAGKKFIKWDKEKLLNSNTVIDRDYTFTAYFDWSGVKVNELVKTESYKDPERIWTNDFVPKIDELKAQVKWVNKDDVESDLPAGAEITIVDEAGNSLSQEDIYEKVKEKNKLDKDELVRTEIFKAKVKFADNSVQDIEIPVKIYKNVYEGLTSEAEQKLLNDALKDPDGELFKITGPYVKVTVNPTGEPQNKDSKVYYVNPKAWVDIPEIIISDADKEILGSTYWSADDTNQNEDGAFDFNKRHKFTKNTVITLGKNDDVIEQKGKDKPNVPENYVKVTVDTTELSTDNTYFVRTFWVNPEKEVWLAVNTPTGASKLVDGIFREFKFSGWKTTKPDDSKTYSETIFDTFSEETYIEATYKYDDNVEPIGKDNEWIPQGSDPSPKDFIKNPYDDNDPNNPDNLPPGTKFEFVPGEEPDTQTPGTNKETTIRVIYPNGEEKEVTVKYNVTGDIVEQEDPNNKPDVPDNFVKVIVKTTEDDIEKATEDTRFERTFWVNPTKVVTIPVSEPTGDVVKDEFGNIVTDAAGNEVKWEFKEWSSSLTANFTEETIITAKYEKTIPEPIFDASLVETYVGREPELSDYEKALKMILGETDLSFDENVSSFEITKDPNVSKPGMTEAKVKVEFNNGQVKEITVPVKVYDNIYPGDTNGDKTSETPDNYVKITVNPKAYDEDEQKIKVYYVNPLAKVTIPEISIKEADKEEYGFKKWTTNNKEINSSNNDGIYDFTKDYQFTVDTEIYAFYEKNGDPEIQIGFESNEIIKNIGDKVSVQEYEDALIILEDSEGKPLVDVKAIKVLEDADTSEEGYSPAKIEVIYDDGKTEEVVVIVKVLPDYVEQTDPNKKPDVPNNFVQVTFVPTDKATDETKANRIFWVNPKKEVTIPVEDPSGKNRWVFNEWKIGDPITGESYDPKVGKQFIEDTTITATYVEADDNIQILYIPADENMGAVSTSYEQLTNANNVQGSTATAKAGYRFVKWIDKKGKEVSREATIKEISPTSEVYVAMFEKAEKEKPEVERPEIPGFTLGSIFRPVEPKKPKVLEEKPHKAYVKGYPEGDFKPEGKMTRAEAVTIIVRLENYILGSDEGIFSDTKKQDWFNKFINAAYNKGILEEKSGEKFRPNDPITRGELARLISVIDKRSDAIAPFADVKGHKYERYINQAYGNKRILGYPDGTFRPDADITRAEVTAMINRLYDRKADDKSFDYLANHYDLKKFTDMNPSHWAYYDVMEAANSHRYERRNYVDDMIVENWKRILVEKIE
ncbi:S-layer homology domain-containing protein [Neofamilia massiliensis]|uniref:S-layer homology domain-containing protein n=1 Tax=Neofamilia massiliensis TaxID=1673724 RepID=UPI0006BB5771|nr:S-layer homology domain-containing protein [Neofamilia massiliensis]